MARPRTRAAVHDAVLLIAAEDGFASISMEGVATRAGISKQTLYRTWSSTGEILFDALLARSADKEGTVVVPDTGDLTGDLEDLISETIAELTDPTHDRLLRAVTAEIQTDKALAAEYHDRLLLPQLRAVTARLQQAGIQEPDSVAELLLGPVLYRWLLRTGAFGPRWAGNHVRTVLRATKIHRLESYPH